MFQKFTTFNTPQDHSMMSSVKRDEREMKDILETDRVPPLSHGANNPSHYRVLTSGASKAGTSSLHTQCGARTIAIRGP